MFSGLIPGLNSVNWPDNEVTPSVPAIFAILLNLPNRTFSPTNATLFTHSLRFFRRELSECRSPVLLIYFCLFIPIVVLSLSSGKRENKGGGDTATEVAGEPAGTDDPPGSMRLFRKALLNATGDFILPESYDPSENFCGICLEEKQNWRMFRSENCSHSFCYDCTSKHIEAKVQANITVICCPEIGCKAELGTEACRNLVSKDVIVRWDECLCMSLIPESYKVYCPFKDCSAMLVNDTGRPIGETECPACKRLICAKCRVPWHTEFTCEEFERLGVEEGKGREDVLVEELAKKKSWRKCPNCNMCVEKTDGCLHITCRCSYEFCYRCGSKWDKSHMSCRGGQESETLQNLPILPLPVLPPPPSSSSSIEFNVNFTPQSDPALIPIAPDDDVVFRRRGQESMWSWNDLFNPFRPPPPPPNPSRPPPPPPLSHTSSSSSSSIEFNVDFTPQSDPALIPIAPDDDVVFRRRGQESVSSWSWNDHFNPIRPPSPPPLYFNPSRPPPPPPLSHTSSSSSSSIEFNFEFNPQIDPALLPLAPNEEIAVRRTLSSYLSLNRP